MSSRPHSPPSSTRADGLLVRAAPLAGVTALAAVLRFPTLDRQSFWTDETVTVLLVRLDLGGMLSAIPQTESTPPLYYVVAWIWTAAFGSGEIGLRSLSAVAGTLTAALAYLVGASFGRAAALAAGALVATHPLLVWYSQEARSYALLVLLSAASLLCFVRVLHEPKGRALAAWSAVSLLALATHYFALFLIAAEAVALLIRQATRATLLAVAAVGIGAIVLLPLLVVQRGNGDAEWITAEPLDGRLAHLVKNFLVGPDAPFDRVAAAAVGILVASVALLAAPAVRARGVLRGPLGAVGVVGTGALAVPIALSVLGIDYVNTANLLPALMPLILAVATAFSLARADLARPALAAVCAIGAALVVAVALDSSHQRVDWRGAARGIGPQDRARIIVLAPDYGGAFARVPFRVYRPRALSVDVALARPRPQFTELAMRPEDAGAPRRLVVDEIVLVSQGSTLAASLPPEFELIERDERYGLSRFRSPAPVAVAPDRLVRRGADIIDTAVLFEPRGTP